jgi:hypothetical protein
LSFILLLLQTAVTSPTIPAHPVTVDQGQIQVNLHGLAPNADWILGVVTRGNNRVNVSHITKGDIPGYSNLPTKTMKAMEAHDAAHIHTRPGVLDLDGLGGLQPSQTLMIFLDVSPDTNVVVNGDGPTPIYSGKVHDSLQLKDGVVLNAPVISAVTLMQTVLLGHTASPAQASVTQAGSKYLANIEALKEHIQSLTRPPVVPNAVGQILARLTITAQGTVSKVDFPTNSSSVQDLNKVMVQVASTWTFLPFSQGEVTALVPVHFVNGVAHSPLWE